MEAKQLSPPPRTTFQTTLKYKNYKPMKTVKTLTLLTVCITSIALADDFKTLNGKEYKDATVTHVEPDGIGVKTKSGISKLYFQELPKEVQQRFNYDPQQAAAYSAQQNAAMQKSSEQLGKELAGTQWMAQQRQDAASLQFLLQTLHKKNTTRWNISVWYRQPRSMWKQVETQEGALFVL